MSLAVPLYGFGGSGGSPNKSIIIVTAPTGSTVTCKMGSTTKTASEKNGTWTFSGLDIGTWTVTATKGNSIATQDVDITRLTVEYVTITYFSATINVTYPAGSTCTCSDGTTTLTAPNTSGSWTCIVYNAGTWTVSSTDGDKSKSADVVITTDGQTESVTLQYITYLFKDGETYDSLTGGWNGTVNAEKQAFQLYAAAGKTASVWTKSKVDMTDYSTISVKTDANVHNVSLSLIIEDSIAASKPVAKAELNTASDEVSLDISNITGSHFIRLYSYSEKGGSRYVYEVSMQ
jgi:hypothetical protein